MPTTPILALPYPAPSVTPDVPYHMQQLAEAVETAVDQLPTKMKMGLTVATFAAGEYTLTHGLGVAPVFIGLSQDTGGATSQLSLQPKISTATTTTVTVTAATGTGHTAFAGSASFRWVVMA